MHKAETTVQPTGPTRLEEVAASVQGLTKFDNNYDNQ
jgi:hypothetical protein